MDSWYVGIEILKEGPAYLSIPLNGFAAAESSLPLLLSIPLNGFAVALALLKLARATFNSIEWILAAHNSRHRIELLIFQFH
jgi:hypothetical protein